MRVTQAPDYKEPRDTISHDWVQWLSRLDAVPLPVPNLVLSPARHLDGLAPDLLVLTGGDDPGDTPERDATERALLSHALQIGMPVLGVCRGMQLINLHFGGALGPVSGHAGGRHALSVVATEPWQGHYYGRVTVNSFHHQGVKATDLGTELAAFAHDRDGNVEGLYHRTQPVMGVMWHPERSGAPEGDASAFARLIADGTFWT